MPNWSLNPLTGIEHLCVSSNHKVILALEDAPVLLNEVSDPQIEKD